MKYQDDYEDEDKLRDRRKERRRKLSLRNDWDVVEDYNEPQRKLKRRQLKWDDNG